jgi:hypothetical protein
MSKIQSGTVINYILGKDPKLLPTLERIVQDANDKEDILHNHTMLKEGLATYSIMHEHIKHNKWKEGAKGGALAGALLAGVAPAIMPSISLAAAGFRLFSGMILGGTSAVVYNELGERCSYEKKREIQILLLLDTAKDKLKAGNKIRPT